MVLTVYSTANYSTDELVPVGVIDSYQSLIWTERYCECGDFELCVTAENQSIQVFQINNIIKLSGSSQSMIIEEVEISTDAEEGVFLYVRGRSLESILDRRIVWNRTIFNGGTSVQTVIKRLMNENMINPSQVQRTIPYMNFIDNTDSSVTSLVLDSDIQFAGESLYDAIKSICDLYELGFLLFSPNDAGFSFKIYAGVDRTFTQHSNVPIVFSPGFDNLLGSDYLEKNSELKNVALVGGEGEGAERTYVSVNNNSYSGLNRREMFVDAADISSQTDSGTPLSQDTYEKLLKNRGKEELQEHIAYAAFSGKLADATMYVYRQDYSLGDKVQVENEFGMRMSARIIEMIHSADEEGVAVYPTFSVIQD